MTGDAARPRSFLFRWLRHALNCPEACWSPEQISFLESLLETADGARVLSSLVVTTIRLRRSALAPDKAEIIATLLPSIEVFWSNPCSRTYEDLRIARW
ncbi:MAG: hypothetical protein DMH00_06455 [Acidobacteria bacterium]|nr:MAG: hypothetical protein DMH00_06455 [Acidobacteriota bacterium]